MAGGGPGEAGVTYSTHEILDRIAAREGSRWEFKQVGFAGEKLRSPKRDVLADEIAAFANARGGVLLCGVTDDGQVQELSGDQVAALDAVVVELSTDSIKPPVRISTHHLRFPDGRLLAVVEVPEGDAHHRSPGGSFIRVGGTKRRMTTEEQLRLAQRRGQARVRSHDERAMENTGLGTLDEALWKPLLSARGGGGARGGAEAVGAAGARRRRNRARHGGPGFSSPPEDPTSGFGAPPSRRPVTAGRTALRDRRDAREIVGPLNRQVADAMAFAERNMTVAARKDPARVEIPQYSRRALFEAIVNAVAHRDYSLGGRIRFSMFRDRVEIQSPGTLPNNLAIEGLGARVATRNEALVSVLMRMSVEDIPGSSERRFFMERRGDGIEIIRTETRGLSGRLPEFDLPDESEVRVMIPAAAQEPTPGEVAISVWFGGQPVAGAAVLAVFPNGTWKRAFTEPGGEARVNLHSTHLPMTVFAAAAGYAARVESDWIPGERALALGLEPLPDGGSLIFAEAAGYLPGLAGRLNPFLDDLGRTYLHASNIAIDGGKPQPVQFVPGEELRLTDADGRELLVRIAAIEGRSALVEYRAAPGRR